MIQVNTRMSTFSKTTLDILSQNLDQSQGEVIELALFHYAWFIMELAHSAEAAHDITPNALPWLATRSALLATENPTWTDAAAAIKQNYEWRVNR